MSLLICSMPRCQTTVGCVCDKFWPQWAAQQVSTPYRQGRHTARRTDNPYPVGTWEHDQWNRGYDEVVPAGG